MTGGRLRQVAVLARDRDAAIGEIATSFSLEVCHADDEVAGFAMANALLPVGDQFLEVAAALDDSTPAARLLGRRGEGGYLVIVQIDDIDRARRRAEAAGAKVTIEIDRPGVREIHFDPRSTGGVALALDWMEDDSSWHWAGQGWRDHVISDRVTSIDGISVRCENPAGLASLWGQILGIEPDPTAGEPTLGLDDAFIRWVPAATGPPRVAAVHLRPTAGTGTVSVEIGDCAITTAAS